MRSKWTNWLVPALLGYVLPIVFTVLGSVWTYIRVNSGQVVLAGIGVGVTLFAVVVSVLLAATLRTSIRRVDTIRDNTQDWADKVTAEEEQRDAWLKEQDPEAMQRVEELTEEYDRVHQLSSDKS